MGVAPLAELEIFHSRPAQPTRRLALGHLILPADPAPGLGGLLLGAVIAQHIVGVDDDLHGGVEHLLAQIGVGQRVVQPTMRHRFQTDRHGLSTSRHVLTGDGDDIGFEFGTKGSDLAQVLGAVYALERLDGAARRAIAPLLTKAVRWRGPIGPGLVAHLAGSQSSDLTALADPKAWALDLLGFELGTKPSKREVTKAYRVRMRAAHPDHGGAAGDASKAILDLNHARTILIN